jgi:hypothetical protein
LDQACHIASFEFWRTAAATQMICTVFVCYELLLQCQARSDAAQAEGRTSAAPSHTTILLVVLWLDNCALCAMCSAVLARLDVCAVPLICGGVLSCCLLQLVC